MARQLNGNASSTASGIEHPLGMKRADQVCFAVNVHALFARASKRAWYSRPSKFDTESIQPGPLSRDRVGRKNSSGRPAAISRPFTRADGQRAAHSRPNHRWIRVEPNATLSAANVSERGPFDRADRLFSTQEGDFDDRHLVLAEFQIAQAATVVLRRLGGASNESADAVGDHCRLSLCEHTRLWRSTLATSPIA